MPLISPTRELIQVDLSDHVFGTTRFKQRAVFTDLYHNQDNQSKLSQANIVVLLQAFADDNGSYGVHLHDKGVPDRRITLTANNLTLVDATDGSILNIRNMETDKEWADIADAYTQPVMLQGDFFQHLRDNEHIRIGDMIRLHIGQADAMGKFAL